MRRSTLQPLNFGAHFLLLLLKRLLQLRANGSDFGVDTLRNERLGLLNQSQT